MVLIGCGFLAKGQQLGVSACAAALITGSTPVSMLLAGWLFRRLSQGGNAPAFPALLVSGGLAEALMMAGYFLYEAAPFPVGLGLAALANVPFNAVQGVFGLASASAVYLVLSRSRALARP